VSAGFADVVMPRLSDSMEEGTILAWLKQTGDEVTAGEEIVEIETDKANMAYEAEESGVLTVLAEVGETVALGAVIARIGAAVAPDDAAEPAVSSGGPAVAAPDAPAVGPVTERAPTPSRARSDERAVASPLARRVADSLGVDLLSVTGSGYLGRIVKADVEGAAAEFKPPTPPTVDGGHPETAKGAVVVREPSRLQQVVARRMAESKATAPDFALRVDVEMDAVAALREEMRRSLGEDERPPSFNDFVVKASALALRDHPLANGAYRDGRFELYERVNVGVAVATEEALVVPVIGDADRKSLGAIAAEARSLAVKVRDGSIVPPELAGGTFTVSNLGMYGIESFTAVINSPQAAILAVGSIAPRPVVLPDGGIASRRMMSLTLSCDHRILYGANAAQFLAQIKTTLEEPLRLLL
jgi:pyruvate dehydrogenase E2 component (dihydrolipoamide acetyltransferase)